MPGTGVADDKAVSTHVPDMIGFYLGEEPILSNVETYRCDTADGLAQVLDNLTELVIREVQGAGGYGMLIGPASTRAEIAAIAAKVKARPDTCIAQPTLSLSSAPVLTDAGLALRAGSRVVNSSQGGGVMDTRVLREGAG